MLFYMTVDTCEHCKDCPNRLFNTGHTIEVGIGTITSNTLIIIPRTYGKEKRDKFINILKAMWLDITNYELLEQAYVTYDIKCPCYSNYNLAGNSNKYCARILGNELLGLKYVKYIIVFGRAFDVAFIDGRERKSTIINGYPILYIPLSLNKLDDVKHLFAVKDKLFKAITYINNKRIYG